MPLYDGAEFTIYKDRDNTVRWELQQDGVTVNANAVTRAVLRVRTDGDDTVLDTDVSGDDLSLTDNATIVQVGADALSSVAAGTYRTWLTVYDSVNTDGIAWADPDLVISDWKTAGE